MSGQAVADILGVAAALALPALAVFYIVRMSSRRRGHPAPQPLPGSSGLLFPGETRSADPAPVDDHASALILDEAPGLTDRDDHIRAPRTGDDLNLLAINLEDALGGEDLGGGSAGRDGSATQ